MHQVQIDVGEHEQRQRFFELINSIFPPVASLAPKLRRDENLIARNAAVFNCPSNTAFVAVYLRSVDVAISHLESVQASLICLIAVSCLVYAQAHGGNSMPTVKGERVASSSAGH